MTYAELLRSHADLAIKEGGMYYSGEYLSRLATTAESLEAENARLRTQLADVTESMGRVEERCAKLREIVRDMHKALFSLNLDHCQACPREDACVFMHKSFDCSECAFERDMRELGVEVHDA